ncbi:MAG: hypothetical protein RR588_07120 [Solibacillus sp.]
MSISVKKVVVSVISAAVVSMFAVGGSIIATLIFYNLNGKQLGEMITTSRVIGFLVIFVLSFFFILFELDKKSRA